MGPPDPSAQGPHHLGFAFGQQGQRNVTVHIDPSEVIALDQKWSANQILFHLDPSQLDRLQQYWLQTLLQDYDQLTYRGYFSQMAPRCQLGRAPFSPQDDLTTVLARQQLALSFSPYLAKTYEQFTSALAQGWQGGQIAIAPGVLLCHFKCAMRPATLRPFIQAITPPGIGASEPIHIIVDYSQVPSVQVTLAIFFVRSATPPIFPIQEITILPRS